MSNLKELKESVQHVAEAIGIALGVEVEIVDGSISDIRILKGAVDDTGAAQEIGSGKTAADLFDAVVAQRTLQVDTISGATLTCNAHLKALEQALLQAQHEE